MFLRTLVPVFSQFLKRSCNKGTVKISGKRLNRGADHGVDAPCTILSTVQPRGLPHCLKELADIAGWITTKVSVKEVREDTQSQPI